MTKKERAEDTSLPPEFAWQGPISWIGMPPHAVQNYSREFPLDATFVRGEVIIALSVPLGSGMSRISETVGPCLIRLNRGVPIEVQSILPMEGTRRYISLSIDSSGRAANLSNQTDPDRRD